MEAIEPKSDITHLIFCSSGADYELVKHMGLSPATKRSMLYQVGCFGGGTVLRLAKDAAENNPGACVLALRSPPWGSDGNIRYKVEDIMQRTMRPSSFSSFGSEDYMPYTLQDILLHWKNQNQASHRESQSNQMSAMLHPQEEVRQVPVNTIPTVGTSEAYVPGTSSLRCGEKSDLSSGMHHVQQRGRPRLQVHYRLLKLYEHSLICAATQGTCPDKHCSSMKDKLASANGPTIHKSFANWRKWFANLKRTYSTVGLSQALHNLDVPERTEVFGKRMKLDQASHFHPTGPNMEGFPPLVESSCQENNAHSNFVQRFPVQSSDSRRGCVKAHHILRAQWLLCLYLHSLGCSAQECPKPVHCNKMKIYVQSHFNWCNEKNCPRKCAELRGLVKHYTECCQSACAVCGPIRRNFKKDLGGGVNLPVQVDHPSPSVPQMDASTLIPPHLVESSSQIIEGDSAIEKPNEPLEVKMCLSELPSDPGGGEVHAEIKAEGVTFTEHFTLGQMKQHIQSLREGTGKGNAMQYAKNQDSCTLCGLEKLMFEPPCKSCSFCDGIIKRNSTYYNMPREHYCCGQCYKKTRAERFKVYGVQIGKTKLRKMRHDEALGEPWVECCKCQTWQHEICSLFNGKKNEDGKAVYTCPTCYIGEIKSGERLPLPESCVLGAKDLPTCILSDHLENRLAIRLRDERQQRAMNLGMDIDEAPTAENLLIRVVSSIDKSMKVSERFRAILKNNYPSEFPYRSKAIVLFQKIEGVDVLLFAMYVHEYGAECQAPNQRHVYISYLDSIKYFRPDINAASGEALRTFVYHEILIGYLDYVKTRGFTTCYIWASPPMKGDSYILHCRPTMQKIPKSDKLSEWYQAMLRKAIKEDIVVGVTNLYDQYFSSADESKAKITTARLPYFDGDYLPGAIEDTLNCIQEGTNDSKPQKKSEVKISRRTLKAAKSVNIHSSDSMTDILIMQKIGQTIEKIKNNFILAHLQPICTRCSEYIISGERWDCSLRSTYHLCRSCYEEYIKNELPSSRHTFFSVEVNSPVDTRDGDDTRQNEIFFSRHTFLDFCKDNNYQFDSLRRAKHSTMMCIYQMKKFQL